jgi:hypothetical protein
MATRSFRFLSYDMARCHGKGCNEKEGCRRHTQIELDKEDTSERRISYYETLIDKDTDTCEMRITNE